MTNLTSSNDMLDLSSLPFPDILETLDFETLYNGFITRFIAFWNEVRLLDPTLPVYDVDGLETDPVAVVGQAYSFLRLLDRQRVNDAVKAVLAPFAQGADLDNVVARQGVARMAGETDARLLLRYLLSFDRESAGSSKLYRYQAYTAWDGVHHATTAGRAVHGRKGDTDIVISTIDGTQPTEAQYKTVLDAVTLETRTPEAMGVFLRVAEPEFYSLKYRLVVPAGADWELLRSQAIARVRKAALTRTQIGAKVPSSFLQAAAYQDNNIQSVEVLDGFEGVFASPYQIPILSDVEILLPGE